MKLFQTPLRVFGILLVLCACAAAQQDIGIQAPAGESISGLGVIGGYYSDSDGWLSGWALNGNPNQNALPADDDCLTYNASPCAAFGGGWFPISDA